MISCSSAVTASVDSETLSRQLMDIQTPPNVNPFSSSSITTSSLVQTLLQQTLYTQTLRLVHLWSLYRQLIIIRRQTVCRVRVCHSEGLPFQMADSLVLTLTLYPQYEGVSRVQWEWRTNTVSVCRHCSSMHCCSYQFQRLFNRPVYGRELSGTAQHGPFTFQSIVAHLNNVISTLCPSRPVNFLARSRPVC